MAESFALAVQRTEFRPDGAIWVDVRIVLPLMPPETVETATINAIVHPPSDTGEGAISSEGSSVASPGPPETPEPDDQFPFDPDTALPQELKGFKIKDLWSRHIPQLNVYSPEGLVTHRVFFRSSTRPGKRVGPCDLCDNLTRFCRHHQVKVGREDMEVTMHSNERILVP
jgi:hypothetical protein